MSKIDAPEIEPDTTEEKVVKAPRPRGKYIDFVPRRKTKKTSGQQPKVTVVVTPVVEAAPIEETVEEEPIEEEPVVIEEATIIATPDDEPEEEYDDGPLAEFSNLDDDFTEEAQEDFIADDTDSGYVEEVLSKTSETKTETTIRRSPFITNYHVEKRPLSTRIPVRENVPSVEALEPTPRKEFKEEEFVRHADKAPENAEEPVETQEEKTGSKLGMALTVLITVLLGAGVGIFVYLAFFK